ncbi:MAG: ABC transporter ATP-binding protein [Methanospirillum sp.]|nr:ABC transporter ATP-binding protein [Methanospirillum sp.]
MATAIAADGLSRSFGTVRAVDGVSFEVPAGEVFGLLGPNGAGKTTLIRLLAGVLLPGAGSARVLGLDPWTDGPGVRRRCGVLTETPAVYGRLTARQNLGFAAEVFGVPLPEVACRVNDLLARFSLADRADEPVGGFSKGMKQRLALARALVHDPELLFLDEPTAGLDPAASRQVHEMVGGLREEGRTVVLCTHRLVEAEALCDRVGVLAKGRLVALGTVRELSERLLADSPVALSFLDPVSDAVAGEVGAVPGVTVEERGERHLLLAAPDDEALAAAVGAAVGAGGRVVAAGRREHTLEDVYFALQEAAA